MKRLEVLPKDLDKLNKKVKSLYCIGNTDFLNLPKIAIVGSRRPSSYTKNLVIQLASKLSKNGICIISGAAMGVDAIAHEASLPNTIAVMGNSLDIFYPIINKSLIEKIYSSSLAISEYEPSFGPKKYTFIERNRIVIALSKAVVIPQADLNSGSMSSAKIALKLKIPLYVLPQRIHESEGTNKLLSNAQAKLISDIDEFVNLFISNGKNKNEIDEIIDFCKKEPNLDICIEKFGSKIYEYELDGKICIKANKIVVL